MASEAGAPCENMGGFAVWDSERFWEERLNGQTGMKGAKGQNVLPNLLVCFRDGCYSRGHLLVNCIYWGGGVP